MNRQAWFLYAGKEDLPDDVVAVELKSGDLVVLFELDALGEWSALTCSPHFSDGDSPARGTN